MVKDIPGYEGLYEIDTDGNIYSKITSIGRRKGLIKQYGKNGYLSVALFDKYGKCRQFYVHRLVAITFISNPEDFPVVNHKDANKHNNHIDNLEWCTQKHNIEHSIVNGLQRNVRTSIYDLNTETTMIFQSMRKASEWLGKYSNFISLHLKDNIAEFIYDHYVIKVVI